MAERRRALRARTFQRWMRANFDREQLEDIANYGCAAGWPGLTYYRDTTHLYDKYKGDIWDMLYEDAESCGYTIPELIATFSGAEGIGGCEQFENLLVWYAAETIARQLTDGEGGEP